MTITKTAQRSAKTRGKLLEATIGLMRRQGYAGTTVDQICARAGVTKGAFFHYFSSKEAIGRAAVDDWCQQRAEQYRVDLGNPAEDPLVRIDRLLDGLIESIRNPPDNMVVCLLGMLSQEMALSNETMRTQFCQHLEGWSGFVTGLLKEACETHPEHREFDPEQVGWLLNSLWQGSLLVAKTTGNPQIVVDNLEQARDWINGYFAKPEPSVAP
jgi:TetR/AcrR family transcriptional repressor of nem operon